MANTVTSLTAEGRQKLIDELEYLEGEKHEEIVARLKEARDFGDLSENSEYDVAKDEQEKYEKRVNEIRYILATAKVVEASGASVSIGTTVELEDKKGKTSFDIVGTTETDSINHRISNESPLGAALIGHVVGDTVTYRTPAGKERSFTIVGIAPTLK